MIVTFIHSRHPSDQRRVKTRCRNLAQAIRRTGLHQANLLDLETFVANGSKAREICSASDLLVVHRYLYGPVINTLQSWKAHDKKVMVDIDTAVDKLTPGVEGYHFWMEGQPYDEAPLPGKAQDYGQDKIIPPPVEQLRMGLRLADAATVSSTRLADDWADYVPVLHIPDYLNLDEYLTIKQDHPGEVWIGLSFDGISPIVFESTGLRGALEQVCRQRRQVRLVLVGADPQYAMQLDTAECQKMIVPLGNLDAWPRILSSFDVGLAPLEGDSGMREGWQRVLEYMVMKVPWIGSDLPSYREVSRFGWLTQNTPQAWERGLLELVDHMDAYRAEAAGLPFLFALGQDVNENITKVLASYASIVYSRRKEVGV